MIKNRKINNEELRLKDATVLVGSDVHFPFQDDKAVDEFISAIKYYEPEVIVLNGDIMDFYQLSRFTKDPKGRDPEEEIEMCREFLGRVRKAAGDEAKIYYPIGNHETRLTTYMLANAPRAAHLIENVFDLLKVQEFGVIGCHSLLVNDTFMFKHGSRLGSKSGLSAIKELEAHYLSGATGHTHRLAKFTTRKSGKRFVWFETGCLCTLDPEYCIQPDWQQGYVVIKFNSKGKLKESYIVEIGD